MADESNNQPENPAAPEEEKKQEVAAQAQPEAPAETFGYPNTLLLANDIDPEILVELPEDVREAVLAPLADQLRQHRAAAQAQ